MGDVLRKLAVLAALALLALPVAAVDAAAAQSPAGKKPAAASKEQPANDSDQDGEDGKKTAQLVQQAFDAGIKAYNAGKYEEAQRAFEAAMRGGLPSSQMPRALYYRGLVFRKLGKPGFAVSDLTSALWLKGGLSEAERADAVKARALAYQEAGVSNVPPVPHSAYAEAPALPGQETAMAAAGVAGPAPSNAPPPSPPPSSSGGVTGFFSSLFGGGSSGETTTASLPSTPPAPAQETAGWGGTTEVAPAAQRGPQIGAPFVSQVAAVAEPSAPEAAAPVTAAPASSAPPSGKYRVQVAAVRSRSEADALASLLEGRHGDQLGGRHAVVDETIIGSMGTFYRVQLGPYASASEPDQLCAALRSDGFDCLVVTQ